MIHRDDDGTVLVLELIRRDVGNQAVLLKPRMSASATLAKYIVKAAMALIFKVLSKEQGRIAASPTGEVLEGDTERFRIALHNCRPETRGKLYQFVYVSLDHSTGELFVTKSHPISFDALVRRAAVTAAAGGLPCQRAKGQ